MNAPERLHPAFLSAATGAGPVTKGLFIDGTVRPAASRVTKWAGRR